MACGLRWEEGLDFEGCFVPSVGGCSSCSGDAGPSVSENTNEPNVSFCDVMLHL